MTYHKGIITQLSALREEKKRTESNLKLITKDIKTLEDMYYD